MSFVAALSAKKISRSTAGTVAIILFLSVLGIFMIIPFVYAILQSLKPIEEIYIFPPRFWVV